MQFLLSVVKQVSHIAVTFLDQNGRAKEKISRPRNQSEGVLGFEQGSYFKQRGSTSGKMDVQQLPQELCTTLGSNMTIVEELQET